MEALRLAVGCAPGQRLPQDPREQRAPPPIPTKSKGAPSPHRQENKELREPLHTHCFPGWSKSPQRWKKLLIEKLKNLTVFGEKRPLGTWNLPLGKAALYSHGDYFIWLFSLIIISISDCHIEKNFFPKTNYKVFLNNH